MKVWCFGLIILVVVAVKAHDADFDEEAEVLDVEPEELESHHVIVEKVTVDVPYISPSDNVDFYTMDNFDDDSTLGVKWVRSLAKKDGMDESIAKYDGTWAVLPLEKEALTEDQGLVLTSKAKHAAISSKLKKPFLFSGDKQLIVQYEVAFQNGLDCGGGYIKLLNHDKDLDLRQVTDKTPYTIMFGPDKCGSDAKLHFIFRHKHPLTGVFEEKHSKKVEGKGRGVMEEIFKDKKPHLLRLILRPDNTFEVSVDQTLISHGTLLDSFTPSVNPPAEVDDPKDFRPENWDEREKIPDPEASKPMEWDEAAVPKILDMAAEKPTGWLDDEPDMVADPESSRPEDWDDEMDGDWEPALVPNPACSEAPGCGPWNRPMVDNPDYKGKWFAPQINNPGYQGKWKPAKIANPDFYEDKEPFKMTPIGGISLELWSMSDMIYFDNFLITDNLALADNFVRETFDLKVAADNSANGNMFRRIFDYSNKNPWLYAVYVVLVGLPTVLIVTFCCSGSSEKAADSKSSLNDPKKTDEPQDDDDQQEDEEEEDVGDDQEEEEEESPEDEAGEEQEEPPSPTTRSQTRKRKPRKD